jgi:peptidoglycan/xylan/chitin deacetylase (PgdA/CDA1 family)
MKDREAVYLTFDDGPTDITQWVLDLLKDEGVKATFFCVGSNLIKHPQLKDRIIAEGHGLGSHTMDHEKATKTAREDYRKSVLEAIKLSDSRLFRPPYGRLPILHKMKLPKEAKVIMWSWLSYDFDEKVPVERILEKLTSVKPGDILVFHDNERVDERIKKLLPQVITSLKSKGFKFNKISA